MGSRKGIGRLLPGFLVLLTGGLPPAWAQDRASGDAPAATVPKAGQPGAVAAALPPPATRDPSPTPTAATARGETQTQALTFPVPVAVNERPFGSDLIVLPVDHLFGDWWGLRTRLEDDGITPTLTFVSD